MESVVKKLEGCKREIEIIIPAEEPEKVYADILKDFRRNIQLPGFRKGKVPVAVIEKRFAKEIEQEVIQKIVPNSLDKAITDEKLFPVEQPTLEDVEYVRGGELKVKASFEVKPEITLEKYKELEISIKADDYKVEDKTIDDQLEYLQKRGANLEPVDKARKIKRGDFVVIDLKGEPVDDEENEPFQREGITIEIVTVDKDGGFTKNLVGANVGDTLDFEVVYPQKFQDPHMAGKTVKYNVEVRDHKVQVVPELDDEFAKDLGQFENLDALKAEIRRQLEEEKAYQKKQDTESLLMEKIIADNPDFELPQVMVQRQLANHENEMRRQMYSQGVNPDHIGFNWDEFKKNEQESAEKGVKRILILDAVSDKEDIKVTAKEITTEIDKIAIQSGQDPKEMRREMMADGRFEAIGSHLRDKKAVDWLLENNTIKEG